MKTRLTILILILLTVHLSYGQKMKTPKNIADAITVLQTDCPDSLKTIIKKTGYDSLINLFYPWNKDYKTIYEWTKIDNKKSKIKKYLIKKGVSSIEYQQTVILIALKKTLLGESYNENEILLPYQTIESKWAKEDSVRFTTDSLRGVFIPKNLDDCFKQIDSFWDDSTKVMVKQWTEDEFIGRAHFSFGMWMRNNWQLWGGSRLSKYFNDLGVYHPDDMSGIILNSYYRYLTGNEINLQQQLNYINAYWKVNKDPAKNIYPKGVRKLEFNSKQVYNLKRGNTPACVHIQSNSKTDKVWIYDYHFGWKHLSKEELKKLNSTTHEDREETIRTLFGKQE